VRVIDDGLAYVGKNFFAFDVCFRLRQLNLVFRHGMCGIRR
jgi:hypothetical protein